MPVTLPPYLQGQTSKTAPTKKQGSSPDYITQLGEPEAAHKERMAALDGVNSRLEEMRKNAPPKVPRHKAWEEKGPMSVEEYAQKYGAAAAQIYAQYLADPNFRGSPGMDPDRGRNSPGMDVTNMNQGTPQYATGGLIGPGGQPATPTPAMPAQPATPGQAGLNAQQQSGQPMSAQVIDMRLQEMMSSNPQMVEQIKQAITQAMQTGELTAQELNMMAQLAKLAAQNPAMYPKIRQFAITNGIATDQDLPQQYDEGLVITILAAAKAAQGGATPQQNAGGQPAAEGQAPMASMASGGPTPTSPNADGSTKIIAHEGEYVIPAHVVRQKGTDFFDKMIGVEKPK